MNDLAIDRIEVLTVGPPTQRLSWALEMPGQYMTGTVVRLTTAGGLVGFAGAANYSDFSHEGSVAEALRSIAPSLLGQSPLHREAIWQSMLSKTIPRAPQAQSLLDVALWDLVAKAADMPLWQLLGGARDRIAAYASTPLLADAEAYVDEVARLRAQGFGAIKFHCWCESGRDLAMVRRVHASGQAEGADLMLDVEQRYDATDALRVGRALGEMGYVWFEAPLDDYDLRGYQRLTRELDIDVVPAGNSVVDHRLVAFALGAGCWDRVRIDVMTCGGLTGALKVMALAEAHGTTVELQCWGYTLGQAANLALMLGQANCTYFEQPTPYEAFEYGAETVIRTGVDGCVHAPAGSGLGIETDWAAMERAALGRLEFTRGQTSASAT